MLKKHNEKNTFDKSKSVMYNSFVGSKGRLAQLGERLPYKQDVGSSILSSPTIFNKEL